LRTSAGARWKAACPTGLRLILSPSFRADKSSGRHAGSISLTTTGKNDRFTRGDSAPCSARPFAIL
jgi:hypothetical protein